MTSKITISAFFLWVALFFGSCGNPGGIDPLTEGGFADLRISLDTGSAARTVLPDFSASVARWEITLSSHDGYETRTFDGPDDTVTFNGVETGTWDLSVTGYNGNNQPIADGSLTGQVLAPRTAPVWTVTVVFRTSGHGAFILPLTFPESLGIDRIEAALDGTALTGIEIETPIPGIGRAVLTGTGVRSGAHILTFTLYRGTESAGTFREAVNIWDNITSNRWIGPDGALLPSRDFDADDLFDANPFLGDLVLIPSPSGYTFDEETDNYSFDMAEDSLRFTPTGSVDGQTISYKWNNGPSTSLISGSMSSQLDLASGNCVLVVTVTSPDRQHSRDTTITFTKVCQVVYRANGGSGAVPADSAPYPSGTMIRIGYNTGNLQSAGKNFVSWNTRADGTGTSYAPGQGITITSNLTLYAQYVSGSFIAGGNCQHEGPVIYGSGTLTELTGTFCHDVYRDASGASPVNYAAGSVWDGSYHNGMIWKDGRPGAPLSSVSHVYFTSVYPGNGRIYVSGFDGSEVSNQPFYAVYDTTGANPSRVNLGSIGAGNRTHDILADNGDVFVAGQSGNGPVVWKNGVIKQMPGGNGTVRALALAGNTLYATGRTGTSACYWKSEDRGDSWGAAVTLTGGTEACSVVVNGPDLHFCGFDTTGMGALYWKNASPVVVLPDGSVANSLTLIGGQPFIVGNEEPGADNERAILWVGGKAYPLWAWQGTDAWGSNYVSADAVTVPARTVTFNHNGAFLPGGTMQPQLFLEGQTLPLRPNQFVKTGWTFAGWATSADGNKVYDDGGSFTMGNANVTLYARWSAPTDFSVGDVGPADGRIVYVNPTAGTDGWTYMEAAPDDGFPDGATADRTVAQWSNVTNVAVGGLVDVIGAGKRNTLLIMAQKDHSASAAKVCADSTFQGVDDWFLPTFPEIERIETSNNILNLGLAWDYFVSTEDGTSIGHGIWFDGNYSGSGASDSPIPWLKDRFSQNGLGAQVRPMRVFNTPDKPVRLIAYHANGGNGAPADKCYNQGASAVISDPGNMSNGTKIFLCWNTKPDGTGIPYAVYETVTVGTEDLLLYAIWGTPLASIPNTGLSVSIQSTSGGYIQKNPENQIGFNHYISPFTIGCFEVTYELWTTVRLWGEGHGYVFGGKGTASTGPAGDPVTDGNRYIPVGSVVWRDAIIWCNAYSEMSDYEPCYVYGGNAVRNTSVSDYAECIWANNGYRLPTEGEWQLAASSGGVTPYNAAAGSPTVYVHGTSNNNIYDSVAWYSYNSGTDPKPVGGKTPNNSDIYDMSGNVMEWCWDSPGPYPTLMRYDYQGPNPGYTRVHKGGGASDHAGAMIIGERNWSDTYSAFETNGLRVVRRP
jgi:uncharacterized repeat protein (TIGR02543 family)